jgi:lipopolysaccharide transport system ATP-binding protein
MSEIITVEKLGKKYQIAHRGEKARYKTLRETITFNARDAVSGWRSRNGTNGAAKATREEFWALQDVSFEVKQGDVVGIIGRNGAGKSTLLKILSRITEPSQGRVRIRGRVASLLEVGTGFHPELTGRENIFLNGAILGMSKLEIKRKFDEIVAFSEVEKFLDMPVKRYSSGMYVRLAFAVAVHLDPDILIIDEVLAVGDASFQKKCLGKIDSVVHEEQRTVLLVTHQLAVAAKLCSRCLLFDRGMLRMNASPVEVIDTYYSSSLQLGQDGTSEHSVLKAVSTLDSDGLLKDAFHFNEDVNIRFVLNALKVEPGMMMGISVKDYLDRRVFSDQIRVGSMQSAGDKSCQFCIPKRFLAPGNYGFMVVLHVPGRRVHEIHEITSQFKIVDTGSDLAEYDGTDYGCVQSPGRWIL